MDKKSCEFISGSSILDNLRGFLTHEDPNIRSKTCNALGNMCRHSAYFYDSLARHHIIGPLIDRCADPDRQTRKNASFAVRHFINCYEIKAVALRVFWLCCY
ncbi:hypothetical protein GQ457_07G018820 [Hibiscus cannabinus]